MSKTPAPTTAAPAPTNFIRAIIDQDNKSGKHGGRVATRFPPEPNGYLHIGHAKSICLNFGLARDYGGTCNLRFDDTNPVTEDVEFTNAIAHDIEWLGFKWSSLFHASDYFGKLYECAEKLIELGLAYVDGLTADQIRAHRGTLTEPGQPSPDRDRPAAESLDLLRRMKAGEFEDGKYVLRAKIDMASPNINLRDPTIYRIRRAPPHHKTGSTWAIYPMYDYAHCISDALEGITHSICTLEFEDHRPLYDWFLDVLGFKSPAPPQQIEFARLNINYTVTSKRKLKQLVEGKHVSGWDDPRMPTIAGLRRRGVPPEALRDFCDRIGVARANSGMDMGYLEAILREHLDRGAPRAMCVLRPLKVTIESYDAGKVEVIETARHPSVADLGTRKVPFSRTIYIERDDFMMDPPKDFFRLGPGREVRLRNAYIIKCERVITDAAGNVTELVASHDPTTLGKNPADGRKVKGIVHWVSAEHAQKAEVRLYERLFTTASPGEGAPDGDFLADLNPRSLEIIQDAWIEPSLATAKAPERFQFERLGYFTVDARDAAAGKPVFNRIVTLKDTAKDAVKPG
jgi:glutaminyl-tRNA synthetase